MPIFGLSLALTLRGHYHLLSSPLENRAFESDLTLDFQGIRGTLFRREGRVTGKVTAEGLAERRVLEGTVSLRGAHEGQVLVSFSFEGTSGSRYTVRGFVEVLPAAPLATITEVPVSLYDASDAEIGRGTLRFDLRGDLGRVLRSIRLRAERRPDPS
jgi:hypothetical protein